MITITESAANQIRESAKQGDMHGMPLRIAAKITEDGKFEYGMGFDDNKTDQDIVVESEGIEILISPNAKDLLIGSTLDFVELEDGQFSFIFQNPNDPAHQASSKN